MRSFHDPAVLDHADCERLLRAGIFGRVALTTPGGPEIVPVHYRVMHDEIVVRTETRTLLARWAHRAQVSFEVDLVDYVRWAGWSVVARGVATVVADEAGDGSGIYDGPRPQDEADRYALVRLPWTSLTGRQLGRGDTWATAPGRSLSL